MSKNTSQQPPQGSRLFRAPPNQRIVTPRIGDASLLILRMKELDREFNRQSKQLAHLAKNLKHKIAEHL